MIRRCGSVRSGGQLFAPLCDSDDVLVNGLLASRPGARAARYEPPALPAERSDVYPLRSVAVPMAVHQPAPDRTVAVWLDLAPDLSCKDSTKDHCVDVEHQPTDLAVGGSNPSRRAKHAGQSLYPSSIYLHCCGSPGNDLQILTRVVRWIEGSDRPWPAS